MWLWLACAGHPPDTVEETDLSCDAGLVLDGDACVPERCGVGKWGSIADIDVWVEAGATGDGSEAAPYGTIGEAVENLGRSGGLIAVAAGAYGRLVLEDRIEGVRIEGRCPEMVSLNADDAGYPSVLVDQSDPDTPPVLAGVTITGGGPGQGGLWVYRGSVSLRDADVADNEFTGVLVSERGAAALERVVVRGTRLEEGGRYGGRGVEVQAGTLTCVDCAIDDNEQVGVFAASGADVTLTGGSVTGTASTNDANGQGVLASEGATVTVEGTRIAGNHGQNAVAIGPGSSLTLRDVTVADAKPADDAGEGRGVTVEDHASAVIIGGTVSGNPSGAILADHGSTAEVRGTMIRDNGANLPIGSGYGLVAQRGAIITAADVTLTGNAGTQLVALDGGAKLDLARLTVEDTAPDAGGVGRGIEVGAGGSVTCTGCAVRGATQAAALVSGGSLTLVDCEISASRPGEDGFGGFGVIVGLGGSLTLTRATVTDHFGVGVDVEGATATITDSTISGTKEVDYGYSAGLSLDAAASATVTGSEIDGNTHLGVSTLGHLVIEDSTVSGTVCGADGYFGRGLVQGGGDVTIRRTSFLDNREVGVMTTAAGATLALEDVTISGVAASIAQSAPIGVVVQAEASLSAVGLEVSGVPGPGLYVAGDGRLACDGCLLVGAGFAGAVVLGGELTLESSTVTDGTVDASGRGGVGIYASDRDGFGTLSVEDSVIGPHPYAGVWLSGPGAYQIVGSTISGGEGYDLRGLIVHGDAVYAEGGVGAWDGATGLRIAQSSLEDSAGPALFLDASSATLEDVAFSGNTLDVRQQRCEGVTPLVTDGSAELCPAYNAVTVPLDFEVYLSEISATGG